ncbi:protein of unknown function [Formosa sp. Hel1_31_208]|uniref:DMP19 family protein n=1 Tax=Formosa sp. Hel1_31_208 TaxID=1798225 RepID=UPI00087C027B|nr:DUF4375 domain-containing protein [Formosa sp. Hel1_31_208]SDS44403.1 protein of unknown function [Formosa sp. Hel1_31_208]
MTEIDFALNQTQDTEIIELVGTVLWNKSSELGSFEALSPPEQTFIYIDIFESELLNGGLFDFFYNTSGAYAHQVLEAYQAIGAYDSVNIVAQAIHCFPELPIPKDIFKRRSYMANLDDTIKTQWENLEVSFLDSKEDIVALLITYIKAHKTRFEY